MSICREVQKYAQEWAGVRPEVTDVMAALQKGICTSAFSQGFTPTPCLRDAPEALVPERVSRLQACLSPPPLGIHRATPDAHPPPLATAPQARPRLSDQRRQKRNAQKEVRAWALF